MGRIKKLRYELENDGIITHNGLEVARLTLMGNLIIDPVAVYSEIESWAATHNNKCGLGHLNIVFGRSGTYGFDTDVYAIVLQLESAGFVMLSDKNGISPRANIITVGNHFGRYTTHEEAIAGLESM